MAFRVIAMLLAVFSVASRAAAEPVRFAAATFTGVDTGHWSSFLPLMAEEAIKRGYELPLPFRYLNTRFSRQYCSAPG
jgi:hypothetical protein